MKKYICTIFALCMVLATATGFAKEAEGIIVYYDKDLIIIKNTETYTYNVGEVYSFNNNNLQNVIVGEMGCCGLQRFYNLDTNSTIQAQIEKTNLTEREVEKWFKNKKEK